MNIFRKSRDTEGKFALTTLQNPLIDVSSQLELAASTQKRIEERLAAAERQNLLASAPVPPPLESAPPAAPAAQLVPSKAFAEQKTARDDESNSIPTSTGTLFRNPLCRSPREKCGGTAVYSR